MGESSADTDAPDVVPHDADAPERPRFPYAVAAFALACVICAIWLWMRYSYCWDFTVADISRRRTEVVWGHGRWPAGAYVRVAGVPGWRTGSDGHRYLNSVAGPSRSKDVVGIIDLGDGTGEAAGVAGEFVGRIYGGGGTPLSPADVDFETTRPGFDRFDRKHYRIRPDLLLNASRFTPASVAGLVVAAMGTAVFALHLRRWLAERRAFRTLPRPDA
ncbi:MAG: hypothetical protein ACYTKD_23915 [Planctomycetota bacterium]|jgi:hypothetical protein